MAKTKIAVTLDSKLVQQLDALVAERRLPNRSQAIERRTCLEIVTVRPAEVVGLRTPV